MKVWYVEVKRARDDLSPEVSKVGYLHEPTQADLAELTADGWDIGLIGEQTLTGSKLGRPGSDPVTIRAHATVIAAFLEQDMKAFLDGAAEPPTSTLQEAKAICAAADDAGLTELAAGLQSVIDEAQRQIGERSD